MVCWWVHLLVEPTGKGLGMMLGRAGNAAAHCGTRSRCNTPSQESIHLIKKDGDHFHTITFTRSLSRDHFQVQISDRIALGIVDS